MAIIAPDQNNLLNSKVTTYKMKRAICQILLSIASLNAPFWSFAGNGEGKSTDQNISLYQKISSSGLSYPSFVYGYGGYQHICDSLHIGYRYLCIADFALPSSQKRLYIIDMKDSSIFHSDYVAHGRNSGELNAESFSNDMHSFQSSLGFYLISESYDGKHGLSIRLDGLDKGFNDRARERAIVMHSAEYAEPTVIASTGRLGRSLGCPALPQEGFMKIAPFIAEKSVLFIYYPQEDYLIHSVWLNMPSNTSELAVQDEFSQNILPQK